MERPWSEVDAADALEQAEDLGPAEDDNDVLDEEPAEPGAGVFSPLDRVR